MTTTEKTVAVPVAALERLVKERTLRYYDYAGALYEVRGDAMADLVALIPDPPKVGDVLTKEQIGTLPPKSVLRDRDGDVWVTTERGPVYLTFYSGSVDGGPAEDMTNPTEYAAVLVYIPRD